MSTGTKALMAAGGSGGATSNVVIPYVTNSDASGSDKYYFHLINTSGDIQFSTEIGYGAGSGSPWYYFPINWGANGSVNVNMVGDIMWVTASSNNYWWGIDVLTGDITFHNNPFSWSNTSQYGPAYGIFTPFQNGTSGGTPWIDIVQLQYIGSSKQMAGMVKLTGDRTVAPTARAATRSSSWGNEALYNGGAVVGFDVDSTGYSNWGSKFFWQEGSSASSFNVRMYRTDFQNTFGTSNYEPNMNSVTSWYGPTSNYSRGTALRIRSDMAYEKYFDENWIGLDPSGTGNGGTGYKFSTATPRSEANGGAFPTTTTPFNFNGMRTDSAQTFDYEQHSPLASNGVNGAYGTVKNYNTSYGSVAYRMQYITAQGYNYSVTMTPILSSNRWYNASWEIWKPSTPSNVYDAPNVSMRRINDDGYVAMLIPDFSVGSNRNRLQLYIFNGATQVGSPIDIDVDTNKSNKSYKCQGANEGSDWGTALHTGSATS